MPPIGWLEVVVLAQTLLPALLFVPALVRLRTATRAATFLLPLTAWGIYYASGRRAAGARPYPPVPFLSFAAIWLVVSLANPWINTILSALCAVMMHVGVLCPALWAPAAIRDRRQLPRLMTLLLICNGASAVMGILQVYQPDRFRPPEIAQGSVAGMNVEELRITREDGTSFYRPFGLTDSAGGAAFSGLVSCAIGLGTAISPFPWWWRLGSLGLVVCGVAILFFSQVRVMLLVLLLGLAAWSALLAMRGEIRKLTLLVGLGAAVGMAGLTWALRNGGEAVMKRYTMLTEDNAASVYYKNRGAFVEHALADTLPSYPLGAGPGRTGMASALFGNRLSPPDIRPLYAETQIEVWILDGGLPLLVAYGLALAAALGSAALTALRDPDPEIAFWAGVVLVLGIAIGAGTFGGVPFMTSTGVQFWALLAALHGTREAARLEAARSSVRAVVGPGAPA